MNENSCCSSRYEFLFLVERLFDDIGIRTIAQGVVNHFVMLELFWRDR